MPWTTPETFTAGQTLTAASMNIVSENLRTIAPDGLGAWTTYTPTITNVTVGNGTRVGRYCRVGRVVSFFVSFTLGSTSAVSGSPVITLPVTAYAARNGAFYAFADDAGVSGYPLHVYSDTTTAQLFAVSASGTYAAIAGMSATVPFTWGSTDSFYLAGTYEAAA